MTDQLRNPFQRGGVLTIDIKLGEKSNRDKAPLPAGSYVRLLVRSRLADLLVSLVTILRLATVPASRSVGTERLAREVI